MKGLFNIIEFHGKAESLLIIGDVNIGILDFLDVEEHPPLVHWCLLAGKLVLAETLIFNPDNLVRSNIDQRMKLLLDVNKLMFGYNKLIAQVTHIARPR